MSEPTRAHTNADTGPGDLARLLAEHEPVVGAIYAPNFGPRGFIVGCSCLSARDYRAAGYRAGQAGYRAHVAAVIEAAGWVRLAGSVEVAEMADEERVPESGARLTDGEREELDQTGAEHDWPTETDDGLVMRCRCGATPPSHYLGQQVDEALWLWEHRQRRQRSAVERILAARLTGYLSPEQAREREAAAWDEGYSAGMDDAHDHALELADGRDNPYRDAEGGDR